MTRSDTMVLQQRERKVHVTIDHNIRSYILALVANMIGDRDRIPEMGMNKLKPEMIPDTNGKDEVLDTARLMLKLMYDLAENKLPPTEENLLPGLEEAFGEGAQSLLETILNHRGRQDDPASKVASHAFYLADWMSRRRLEAAVMMMDHVVKDRNVNTIDIHAQLSDILLEVAPARRQVEISTFTNNIDDWLLEMEEREARAKETGSVGPLSPFPMLNRKTGPLRKGELDLWSAKTGFGKSTLAWLLAKYAAWGQGFNVLLFAFEQYPVSIVERLMAERLSLTTLDFRDFDYGQEGDKDRKYFKLSDPRWKEQIVAIRNRVEKLEAEHGKIWIVPAAGWGPYDIEIEVAKRASSSQADGRELYVIYDYYDLINARGLQFYGSSQAAALEAITDFLRDAIGQQYGIYTTAFAQDSVNTNYVTRQMPFQSQRIYQRSQRYVRIERVLAETKLPALDGEGKEQLTDALGRPILLHDVGQADSNSLLHVIKCNDGATGYVPVRFWNGRFRVEEQSLLPNEILARVKIINNGNRGDD